MRVHLDLMIVTDPELPELPARVAAALRGARGRVAIQVRDKRAGARQLAELARALLPLARETGAPLLVNDRVDVALALGCEGAHLPESGLDARDARALLGPDAIIGASCHDAPGLARRGAEGCDYATLSPFAESPGKGAPLGATELAGLVATSPLPVLALGGVDAAGAAEAVRAGAAGVAVVRSVLGAADPETAVRSILRHIDAARAARFG